MSTANPPSLGAMLRDAREKAGLSVNDIAERTRIRATLIREIEADDLGGCGGNFYARGHVRSIVTTLGLDPVPFVSRFNMQAEITEPVGLPVLPAFDTPGGDSRKGAKRSHLPMGPVAPRTPLSPRGSRSPIAAIRSSPGRVLARRSGPNWTSAMLVAAAVVAMLAVGSFVLAAVQPIKKVDAGRPQPAAPSFRPKSAPPTSPPPSTPPPQGVQLRLQVTSGSSWVRVVDGAGHQVFEAVMITGEVKQFVDSRSLTVRYGNSSVVRVVLNGQDRGSPAASCGGNVCTQRYVPAPGGG